MDDALTVKGTLNSKLDYLQRELSDCDCKISDLVAKLEKVNKYREEIRAAINSHEGMLNLISIKTPPPSSGDFA